MKKLLLFLIITCLIIGKQCISQNTSSKNLFWVQFENTNDSVKVLLTDSNNINLQTNTAGNNISALSADSNTLTLLNYNPALILNESSLQNINIPLKLKGKNSKTILIVYQVKDTVNENAVWTYKLNSEKSVGLTSQKLITTSKIYNYRDTNQVQPFINTIIFNISEKTVDSTAGFYFGKNDSLAFSGLIAEILFFDTQLKGNELIKWQTYLAVKYGIGLFESDYISSSDTVIWTKNENYKSAIAGIGKDSIFGLSQKQSFSTSEKDYIKLGTGHIDTTNATNNFTLVNGQFIIWANNGKSTDIDYDTTNIIYDNTDYMYSSLMEREWLLKTSGTNTNSIPTQLVFDGSELNVLPTDEFYMLIDRGANENFGEGNAELILPDSISSDGMVYFNNLLWDIDASGSDMFTFSFIKRFTANLRNEQNLLFNNNLLNSENNRTIDNIWNNENAINGINGITYQLYPNPTAGKYILDINSDTKTDFDIRLLDVSGRLIKAFEKKQSEHFRIENELPRKGMYFIEVRSSYEIKVFKIIMK